MGALTAGGAHTVWYRGVDTIAPEQSGASWWLLAGGATLLWMAPIAAIVASAVRHGVRSRWAPQVIGLAAAVPCAVAAVAITSLPGTALVLPVLTFVAVATLRAKTPGAQMFAGPTVPASSTAARAGSPSRACRSDSAMRLGRGTHALAVNCAPNNEAGTR